MRDCQRCGGAVSWTNDTATLYGGVVAHLCNPCKTEWTARLDAGPIRADQVRAKARESHYDSLAAAGTPVSEADWLALVEANDANLRRAYALGLAFVAERVDRKPAELDRAATR